MKALKWKCQTKTSRFTLLQEQPLLLEDLLEQEKREQARQTGAVQLDQIMPNQNPQSILNDQVGGRQGLLKAFN